MSVSRERLLLKMRGRRNYSKREKSEIITRTSYDNQTENPHSLESVLVGFHGRSLNYEAYIDLNDIWYSPQEANCFGESKKIYYVSDKRDPADPYGEGAQGIDKTFFHDHEKAPVLIYDLKLDDLPEMNQYLTKKELNKFIRKNKAYKLPDEFPDEIGWLGKIIKIDYLDANNIMQEVEVNDFGLYVWDDQKTLMAMPLEGEIERVIIWRSPALKVNWRGIIN